MTNPVTNRLFSSAAAQSAPTTAHSATGAAAGTLDSNGFLKVLAAQLQNQDPMAGGSTQDSLQQMTQLGMLDKLDTLVKSQEQAALEAQVGRTMDLIGHTVTYTDDADATHTGVVTSVSSANGELSLTVDD